MAAKSRWHDGLVVAGVVLSMALAQVAAVVAVAAAAAVGQPPLPAAAAAVGQPPLPAVAAAVEQPPLLAAAAAVEQPPLLAVAAAVEQPPLLAVAVAAAVGQLPLPDAAVEPMHAQAGVGFFYAVTCPLRITWPTVTVAPPCLSGLWQG